MEQEQVIKKMHPYFLGFFSRYFLGSVLMLAGIITLFYNWMLGAIGLLFGILIFLGGEVSRRAETYYILDGGVAREYKMFSTSRKFVEFEKIQDIEITQNFFQKIFGIGRVDFDTASVEKVVVDFKNVKNPYEIERIVREKMKHDQNQILQKPTFGV